MRKTIPLSLLLGALLAMPALAAPMCSGSFALSPNRYSEADINAFNLDALRRLGVEVSRAEIWSGCIRVWVRGADGREQMQFFEPLTLRRVE